MSGAWHGMPQPEPLAKYCVWLSDDRPNRKFVVLLTSHKCEPVCGDGHACVLHDVSETVACNAAAQLSSELAEWQVRI